MSGGSRESARSIAREVLVRVRRDSAYANLALGAALRRARAIAPEERSLATELVYGVLRYQRLLDHALARRAREPLRRLDAETLEALRIAAYQVLLLTRVPAYAAVDDAVDAVRRARGPARAGFANAVLRRLDREDLGRDLPEEPVARLAIECSLPDALAARWARELGIEEARALGRRLLERAPLVARANALRGDLGATVRALEADGARIEPGSLATSALRVRGLGDPFASRSYTSGAWTAQDESAQLVSEVLAPRAGERVLDACAGVGGKATHIAALQGDRGEVACVDPSARKLELLREHCLRLGVSSCVTVGGDLRAVELGGELDRVLVDAPCSGLGVLRRHPELRWRLELERVAELVSLQRELLAAAAHRLARGGVLVYAVCTLTPEEGPEQVRWLLEARPDLDLEREPIELPAPAGADGELAAQARGGELTIWPQRHEGDGFFIARLRRRG